MTTARSSDSGRTRAPFGFQSRDSIEAWSRGVAARAARLGPATELMLDLAAIRPGDRVLDLAAGTGEQTILAARRVGPSGEVLATDIATGMLEVAAHSAGEAGLSNVSTQVLDAQRIELAPDSFDAVISRLGIMALPDPHAALAGIHRVLRAGRRCSMMVFSTPERNPYTGLATEILRRYGARPPEPGQAGPFSLGAPGQLDDLLRSAGFREVDVRVVSLLEYFASAEEAARELRAKSPIIRRLTGEVAGDQREAAWAEIEEAFRQFEGATNCAMPGEVLVGAGMK